MDFTPDKLPMTFDYWLQKGIEYGFCGPAICSTHDGIPTSSEEDTEFDDGHDPCLHIIRLYFDAAHKDAVETNHSPSVWRQTT